MFSKKKQTPINIHIEPVQKRKDKINFGKFAKFGGAFIILLILTLLLLKSFLFTVKENESAVVTKFGRIVRVVASNNNSDIEEAFKNNSNLQNAVLFTRKGLYIKLPFIESVKKYNSMLLTYDIAPREVITKDKKKLILDNNAQWIIENPALFMMSMGNETTAHTRLDDILYSKLNSEIGKTDAHVVISDKTYMNSMLEIITDSVNNDLKGYGIKVVDIRVKRTDLPNENNANIFTRMKTEREKQAKQYRSEGEEQALKIKSDADKQVTIIKAEAYEKAQKIKGEGDAEAASIYAEAFNEDPDFYKFYRTLLTYKNTLNGKTKIEIPINSEFAKYLFGAQ